MPEVVGTCTGITEKPSGWVDIEVTVPDKQYPVRLSTKEEGLIIAARVLHGSPGLFRYAEKESEKINPNSGRPYVNRYLEHVEPAENGHGQVSEPHHRAVIGGDKDRAIARMACLKAAAEIIAPRSGTSIDPDYDPALEVMKAAQRFETWVYRDIHEPPFDA